MEVAGALRRAELKKAAPSARVSAAFDALRIAPIRRVQVRPLLAEAWLRRGNLTIGDALYVVLADHLDALLVTADRNLANAPNLQVRVISA